ncbi:MAG: hypothetical protein KDI83_19030 [Gammaproteobacteria bacterium]|nr:hypothetical protein [Gammaproteobacteria bacterium]
MLLAPSVLALITVSMTVLLLFMLAALFALSVLRHWEITSGSELQLRLERRTYLISTLVAYCFLAELVSLLLFVYNAEQMSSQFVGAMCATGVLNLNGYGWPVLFLKILLFLAGAVWLTVNRVDNQAIDYPLVRVKYGLLLLILPLAAAEPALLLGFFLNMDPDVITSCCGSLFTPAGEGVAAELSGVAPKTALLLLGVSAILVFSMGLLYLKHGHGGVQFASAGVAAYLAGLVAIVSCIALYIYEHPHHHCPFCILKGGHGFIGYLLYIPLFVATALALGVGAIEPFRARPSLAAIIPAVSRRHVAGALISLLFFYLIAIFAILDSNLSMLTVWW